MKRYLIALILSPGDGGMELQDIDFDDDLDMKPTPIEVKQEVKVEPLTAVKVKEEKSMYVKNDSVSVFIIIR